MNLSQEEIDKLLEKVNSLSNSKKSDALSDKEIYALREMLQAWATWKSFGTISRYFIWVILTLASLMIAWRQIKEEVLRLIGAG